MANRSVLISFISKFNSRGIKNATKDLQGMERITKGVGIRAKLAFATAGVAAVAFAEKLTRISIKAVIAEQKQVTALSTTLKNLGKASEIPSVLKFADDLQRTSGISEDVLRPSLQSLITTLGDTGAAQTLLTRAIDISVGSGKDLGSVTNALNKAFSGNLTALNKLVPGLDQTKIASNDLAGIMDDLIIKFGGQGAAAAGTMGGALDKLKISAAESAETLGKGIGDALAILGVDGVSSTNSLGKSMEGLASKTSVVLAGLAGVGKDLGKAFSDLNKKSDGQISRAASIAFKYTGIGQLFGALNKKGNEQLEIQKKITAEADKQKAYFKSQDRAIENRAKDLKSIAEAASLEKSLAEAKKKADAADKARRDKKAKEDAKAAAKKAEEKRKDKILTDLESKFDIDIINLAIAKRRAGTDEDKAAVAGLQAIKSASAKDDETALAKLMALDKSRAAAVAADIVELNKLKINIPLYYESLGIKMPLGTPTSAEIPPPPPPPKPPKKESVAPVIVINQISPKGAGAVSTGGFGRIPDTSVQDLIDREMAIDKPFMPGDQGFTSSAFAGSAGNSYDLIDMMEPRGGTTVNVNVAGSVLTEQDLGFYISNLIGNQNRQGNPVTLDLLGR